MTGGESKGSICREGDLIQKWQIRDTQVVMYSKKQILSRNILFLVFCIVAFIIFYGPLTGKITSLLIHKHYALAIPFISIYMIYSRKDEIFQNIQYSFVYGAIVIIAGIALYLVGRFCVVNLNQDDLNSLILLSAFIFWVGGVILFYGTRAFQIMVLSLLILIFMIPFPVFIKERIVFVLQSGSTEVFHVYLLLTGIPFHRDGFEFQLYGTSIEVAKQCSGITSATALFVAALMSGHFYLDSFWRKVVLLLAVFPIAILKNGLRITVLSVLGAYVDPSFLTDSIIHRKGGIPFFVVALSLLFPVVWFLRRSEKKRSEKREHSGAN